MAQFLQELLVDAAYAGLSLHQITLEGVELHIHIIIYVIECTQEWRQIRLLVGIHHDADVFWHHAHVYLASFLLGASSTLNGSITVTSISPSLMLACGAIYTLLPY